MRSNKQIIAILGASSHVAKGLIFNFKDDESIELHCYARDLEKMQNFLDRIHDSNSILKSFSELNKDRIDVIINCIGISFTINSKTNNENIFELTEQFDRFILNYIKSNHETLYINFSSGVVYGTSFDEPASESTKTTIEINNLRTEDYYRIAKLTTEIKHRSLEYYNIIDLRIFNYYSRFIDLSKNYLMTDIILCIKDNRILKTSSENIMRDYIHPSDLANLVKACCENKKINKAIDVKSLNPIKKMEILDYFSQKYDLKFMIIPNYGDFSATGKKTNYYSKNRNFNTIPFKPKYTSFECIKIETEELFKLYS